MKLTVHFESWAEFAAWMLKGKEIIEPSQWQTKAELEPKPKPVKPVDDDPPF
jgi:hypothetical protein